MFMNGNRGVSTLFQSLPSLWQLAVLPVQAQNDFTGNLSISSVSMSILCIVWQSGRS
nr:MAG TPA: hypothetical protein [Caudoviricetes sp.]